MPMHTFEVIDKLRPTNFFHLDNWQIIAQLNEEIFYKETLTSLDWWNREHHVCGRVCGYIVYKKIDKYEVKHYLVWLKCWNGHAYKFKFSSRRGTNKNNILKEISEMTSTDFRNDSIVIVRLSDHKIKIQFETENEQKSFLSAMLNIFNDIKNL